MANSGVLKRTYFSKLILRHWLMLARNFYFQDPSGWHCLVSSSVAMQGTVCENPREGIPYFQHSQGHIAVLEPGNLEKPVSLSDAAQRGADQALHEE